MNKVRTSSDGSLLIYCPACECYHGFNVSNPNSKPYWTWNNDKDKPSLNPSSLLRLGYNTKCGKRPYVCHAWITDGKFVYLSDSTHKYAGQTIEIEDEGDQDKNK